MKYTIILCLIIYNTSIFASDNVNREGFSFAAGMALIGGCIDTLEIDNENNEKDDEFCIPIPLVDLSVGYGFTPQLKVNLEMQSLLIGGFVGVEAQYYINDEYAVDSMYVYAGAMQAYIIDDGFSSTTLGSIGVGYAKEHMEYEIGVVGAQGKALLNLSGKYMF